MASLINLAFLQWLRQNLKRMPFQVGLYSRLKFFLKWLYRKYSNLIIMTIIIQFKQFQMEKFNKLKDKGNDLFKQKNFSEALIIFDQAITGIQQTEDKSFLLPQTQLSKIYVILLTNASLACLNLKNQENYNKAYRYATTALSVDNKNVKALYRRGLAYKQLAQVIQLSKGEQADQILQLYQKAKTDFEMLNILDRDNQLAKEKLSQSIKDIYRITKARGQQIKLSREPNSNSQKPKNTNGPYEHLKVEKKSKDMAKIMKEYKVQQVTQLVQQKVRKQSLINDLPQTRSQLEKAIRTIQKSQEIFILFIYRMSEEYLVKINPTFDMLNTMVNAIIKKGQGQKAASFLKASRKLKCFQLFWKSLVSKEKAQLKNKWIELGLTEQQLECK